MKFDAIKANAITQFSQMVDRELHAPGLPDNKNAPVNLSMKALAADLGMTENIRRDTLLDVKEHGCKAINNWDVRAIARLIEIFPESVPAMYRGKQLTCYMADNENSDWIVEVAQPEQSLDRSRLSMRM